MSTQGYFLVFRPYALEISKKFHLPLFELIKNKVALKIRYIVSNIEPKGINVYFVYLYLKFANNHYVDMMLMNI